MTLPEFAGQVPNPGEVPTDVAQGGASADTSAVEIQEPQIATGQDDATRQQRIDLTQSEEFRRYQSTMDRQIAELRRQAQVQAQEAEALRAQLREYQAQQRQQEFQARLQQAPPHERERLRLQFEHEELAAQKAALSEEAALVEGERRLMRWDDYYVSQLGVPPDWMARINAAAQERMPRERDPYAFHEIRQAAVQRFLADWRAGRVPGLTAQAPAQPQAQVPAQVQAQPRPTPPAVARPASAAPGTPTLDQLWTAGNIDGVIEQMNRMAHRPIR